MTHCHGFHEVGEQILLVTFYMDEVNSFKEWEFSTMTTPNVVIEISF